MLEFWVVSGCRRLFHTCSRSTSLRSFRCGCKHSCIISYGDKTYFEVLAENAIYPHKLWYSWGLPPAPAYREIVWFLPASSRLQLIVWWVNPAEYGVTGFIENGKSRVQLIENGKWLHHRKWEPMLVSHTKLQKCFLLGFFSLVFSRQLLDRGIRLCHVKIARDARG